MDLFEAVVLFIAAFVGAIVGVLSGGAEALVLRKAASGTVAWIVCSTVAYTITMVLLIGRARLWETGAGFTGELATQAFTFLCALIGARGHASGTAPPAGSVAGEGGPAFRLSAMAENQWFRPDRPPASNPSVPARSP
jgi:hypothetical protein